jgi:O-antigen ligase
MKAVRVGICGLVTFAVLAFGGVEPLGQAVLEAGSAALLLLWGILAIRRRQAEIHWNWLYLPFLGLGTVALVQQVFGLTVYPYATQIELLKWGADVVLFFLFTESFRTTGQREGFVWFLITLSFVVSLFGIVQHFTFNGKLYWSLPLPAGAGPFGPFVNRDDFAGFIELTAPVGLAMLLFRAWTRERLVMLILFTVIPVSALILCASRGGIIGFVFESVVLVFLSRARRIGRMQLLGATAIALLAGTFIVWLGVSDAIHRFEQLTPAEISRDRRVSMYHDTWQIFAHHLTTGTGLGTLKIVYPQYESYYDGYVVDHTHNDYLELLADTGLAGGLCGLAFVVLLFWRGFSNLRSAESQLARACHAGALAGCAGILLHSLVDFNLHIPSNALLFLLLASLATSLSDKPRRDSPQYRDEAWLIPRECQ